MSESQSPITCPVTRIHKYIGFQEMKMLRDSFIFTENRGNTGTGLEVIV